MDDFSPMVQLPFAKKSQTAELADTFRPRPDIPFDTVRSDHLGGPPHRQNVFKSPSLVSQASAQCSWPQTNWRPLCCWPRWKSAFPFLPISDAAWRLTWFGDAGLITRSTVADALLLAEGRRILPSPYNCLRSTSTTYIPSGRQTI